MAMPTGALAAVWSGVTFALGIITKSAVDTFAQRREAARKFSLENKAAFLEQQLFQFYWPLYLLLEKNAVIYESLIQRDQDPDSNATRLSIRAESDFTLPNHQAAVKVIEDHIYLARVNEVVSSCVTYVRHVKVLEMLQAAEVRTEPITLGAPYPKGFIDIVRNNCQKLQAEYDQLISEGAVPTRR